jgi:hypothetical protein
VPCSANFLMFSQTLMFARSPYSLEFYAPLEVHIMLESPCFEVESDMFRGSHDNALIGIAITLNKKAAMHKITIIVSQRERGPDSRL